MPNTMETMCRSSILSRKSKAVLTGLLLLLWLLPLQKTAAQAIVLDRKVKFDQPAAISIDRLNNVYLTDSKNNLYQYNEVGELLNTFSPPAAGHISTVEAWNMVKVMLFYDGQQQITILDRFLREISSVKLRDYMDGVARVATSSSDDRFWILNESNFELLKLDTRFPENTQRIPLDLILDRSQADIQFIREYQNNVYLLDKNVGIYVFDNMGNYKKKLPFKNLGYIGFRGDELYFVAGTELVFFNLYKFTERRLPLPAGSAYQHVLVGENFVYLFSGSGFDIFKLQ